MIDLNDVTFLIPIRIDSEERRENLDIILNYLVSKFNTHIILLEDDKEQKYYIKKSYKNIKYIFHKNNDFIFYRTKLLNVLCRQAATPIIVNYDTDVLLHEDQYVLSAELIRNKICDLCYPYNGYFYDVPRQLVPDILCSLSMKGININDCILLDTESYGGCVFFNKVSYIKGGMSNEKFISWGPEDREIYIRFSKLNYQVKRIDGVLYHLSHNRGINSCEENPFFQQNYFEYQVINLMNKEDLEYYIKELWGWIK